jgi:hypothetical protein
MATNIRTIYNLFDNMVPGEKFNFEDMDGTTLENCVFVELTESSSIHGTYKIIYKTPISTKHHRLSGIKYAKKTICCNEHANDN